MMVEMELAIVVMAARKRREFRRTSMEGTGGIKKKLKS